MPHSSQIGASNRFIWPDFGRSLQEIQDHYRWLGARFQIDFSRSIIGGFSRGGAVAVHLALSGQVPVSGFLAVAPSLRPETLPPLVEACSPGRVRGYLVVGERDAWSYRTSLELAEALRRRGIPCELEIHPSLGHDYPLDFAHCLRRALDVLTESGPP